MAFRQHLMYSVVCDVEDCDVDASAESDHVAWTDKEGALEDAEHAWFRVVDGMHLCPKHWRECWSCIEFVLDLDQDCPKCGAPAVEDWVIG